MPKERLSPYFLNPKKSAAAALAAADERSASAYCLPLLQSQQGCRFRPLRCLPLGVPGQQGSRVFVGARRTVEETDALKLKRKHDSSGQQSRSPTCVATAALLCSSSPAPSSSGR